MVYVGIDPGLHGAVAIIDQDGKIVSVTDTPTTTIKSGKKNKSVYIEAEMVRLLSVFAQHSETAHAGIEKVHAMPGQGVSSMFQMGYGYGLWIGILAALSIPYTTITPQSWKKAMMDGMGKEKAASCVRAQQLYPEEEFFTPRGRALDGRGDAILIAEYLRQRLNKTI